ncbi:PREDICTED: uncharacterized protein LOC107353464 isoform X2 [Acropora digitifera]|uniref:uncharacterized protein LOC107353464 isoform X2 n=1 Tax=Acropora digitifera TaxID=70779 RepID=UPI00077A24CF|nr:PREDICTED: uncharacterized protein LOC107353464 isoform X2 [Acropora digitifera]
MSSTSLLVALLLVVGTFSMRLEGVGKNNNIIAGIEQLYEVVKMITQESGQLNYQGRVIAYQAKGGMHGLQWVYDGTAWDVKSGIRVKDEHYKSKQGAIAHAVKKLIDGLKAKGLVS